MEAAGKKSRSLTPRVRANIASAVIFTVGGIVGLFIAIAWVAVIILLIGTLYWARAAYLLLHDRGRSDVQ
jgi:uncharacterized membrane protein (UPF0136 family)